LFLFEQPTGRVHGGLAGIVPA